jgi:hypothetical protein
MRLTGFCGNFFLRGADLLTLPVCDADKGAHARPSLSSMMRAVLCADVLDACARAAYAVELLSKDENVNTKFISIQAALL